MNTVKSQWEKYRNIVPKDAPETQFIETRRAFYSGAWALIMIQMSFDENMSENESSKKMDDLYNEILKGLMDFVVDHHLPPK